MISSPSFDAIVFAIKILELLDFINMDSIDSNFNLVSLDSDVIGSGIHSTLQLAISLQSSTQISSSHTIGTGLPSSSIPGSNWS